LIRPKSVVPTIVATATIARLAIFKASTHAWAGGVVIAAGRRGRPVATDSAGIHWLAAIGVAAIASCLPTIATALSVFKVT
tara:strand:- start:8 stop:250 length:243 start_codon:yes stop_codon:yes gene_type:complete